MVSRTDGLDGEEDESDTVGMRSGRVDCILIRASCGELKSEWKSFTNGSLDYVTDLVR